MTWQPSPEGSGTRLQFTHEGFDLDWPLGKRAFEGMSSGWPGLLARIAESRERITRDGVFRSACVTGSLRR